MLSQKRSHQAARRVSADELPDATNFSASFGKFASTYKVECAELLFSEDLDIHAGTIPAENYSEVKNFFQHVAGAEEAPVLLMKT